MNEPKHCGFCGDTHHGKCSPSSFDYFKCKNCELLQQIPWDVLVFCGLGGMMCGCGKPAEKIWEHISYKEFKLLEDKRNEN